jgi:predicted RNA-binding Zn ribbon-like protein
MKVRSTKPAVASAVDLKLVAGELCLDFVNTIEWHASDHPIELLRNYGDIVAWGRRVRILDPAAGNRLLREARIDPVQAAVVLERAIEIRETIYRVALACTRRQAPVPADLEGFNRELKAALRHVRVAPGPRGLTWTWDPDDRQLDSVLWPILRSAAELLTSERQQRIGQCADDRGCGWLFLDNTKNHSRRWCEMNDCGNRAKARRHYQRSRAARLPRKQP